MLKLLVKINLQRLTKKVAQLLAPLLINQLAIILDKF